MSKGGEGVWRGSSSFLEKEKIPMKSGWLRLFCSKNEIFFHRLGQLWKGSVASKIIVA